MLIRKAEKKAVKARIAISGPSGAGKTFSSLLIAFGLANEKNPKVGIIDTEQHSAELYADEFKQYGEYYVITLDPPFTVEKYIEAIKSFEKENFDVIIVDSLSHAWTGTGGLLDYHSKIVSTGVNSFAAWKDVSPKHNKLIETLLQSNAHIIVTLRAKTEYVIEEVNNRKQVTKVGMSPIQRDGIEYEFMTFIEMSQDHVGKVTKDRTKLLDGQIIVPTKETGIAIKKYLTTSSINVEQVATNLKNVSSLEELKQIWDNLQNIFSSLTHEEKNLLVNLKNEKKLELSYPNKDEIKSKEGIEAITTN